MALLDDKEKLTGFQRDSIGAINSVVGVTNDITNGIVGGLRNVGDYFTKPTDAPVPQASAPVAAPVNPQQVYNQGVNSYISGLNQRPNQQQASNPIVSQPVGQSSTSILSSGINNSGRTQTPFVDLPYTSDRSMMLQDSLGAVPAFNPERNNFAVNQRANATTSLENLLNSYTNNIFSGGDDWATALSKKSARGVLKDQINTVAGVLDSASKISQQDLDSSNSSNLRNLMDQRSNAVDTARLGLQQDQMNTGNALQEAKINSDINAQGFDNRFRQTQMSNQSLEQGFKQKLTDIFNGVGYEMTPAQQSSFLSSPEGQLYVKKAQEAGATGNNAFSAAITNYQSQRQQQDYNNVARGLLGISNPGQLLASQTKSGPKVEYDPNSDGYKIEGTPEQVLATRKILEAQNKDGSKKTVLTNGKTGEQVK